MADNVDITPGTGATVAADLISSALHQRIKITVGADGVNDGDVSSANPLPVVDNLDSATGKTIKVAYTASQTGATVLTPSAGKKVKITSIGISASATGSVYLFDGTDSATTCIGPTFSLAVYGGVIWAFKKPWLSATADNVIKYTSGSGAAGSIFIHYIEV